VAADIGQAQRAGVEVLVVKIPKGHLLPTSSPGKGRHAQHCTRRASPMLRQSHRASALIAFASACQAAEALVPLPLEYAALRPGEKILIKFFLLPGDFD